MANIAEESRRWSELGYLAESDIVEDVRQTALVRFLRQRGAHHWLELVAPNSPKSKLTAALAQGGGFHHLCYEVPSISAATKQLAAVSMRRIAKIVPGCAFGGRLITWLAGANRALVELVEAGEGPLSVAKLKSNGV